MALREVTRPGLSSGSDMVDWKSDPASIDLGYMSNQRHPTLTTTASAFMRHAPVSYTQYNNTMIAPPNKLWKVRSGSGHSAWRADLNNRITTSGLYELSLGGPPKYEEVEAMLQAMCLHPTSQQVHEYYLLFNAQYKAENTRFYHLIDSTIDLTGQWKHWVCVWRRDDGCGAAM